MRLIESLLIVRCSLVNCRINILLILPLLTDVICISWFFSRLSSVAMDVDVPSVEVKSEPQDEPMEDQSSKGAKPANKKRARSRRKPGQDAKGQEQSKKAKSSICEIDQVDHSQEDESMGNDEASSA